MDKKTQTTLYFVIGALFLVMCINLIKNSISYKDFTKGLKTSDSKPAPTALAPKPVQKSAVRPEKKHYPLIPSNPEDYGFVVYSEEKRPSTQKDWNNFMSTNYNTIKANMPEETNKAVEVIKMDADKFTERLKELDGRIDEFKNRIKENPSDKELTRRLDNLYRLKAISESMKYDLIKITDQN